MASKRYRGQFGVSPKEVALEKGTEPQKNTNAHMLRCIFFEATPYFVV